jgi:hypothetical protein
MVRRGDRVPLRGSSCIENESFDCRHLCVSLCSTFTALLYSTCITLLHPAFAASICGRSTTNTAMHPADMCGWCRPCHRSLLLLPRTITRLVLSHHHLGGECTVQSVVGYRVSLCANIVTSTSTTTAAATEITALLRS